MRRIAANIAKLPELLRKTQNNEAANLGGFRVHRLLLNLASLPRSYIQASFWPQLWVLKQAGQFSRNLRSDNELSLIFSVVRPVETILPVFGHRHSPLLHLCGANTATTRDDYNLPRGNWSATAHTSRTISTPIAM